MSGPGWIAGVIKAVNSGDCIVIAGKAPASGGLPPERQVFLSGVVAPRREEPHHVKSRDFLRQLSIGKPCVFHIDAVLNGREQATIFVENTNLALASLKAGCCRLRGEAPPESPLALAQAAASAASLGVWGSPTVDPPSTAADPASLAPHVPLTVVVEAALNGSTLRCTITSSNKFLTATLAGVQCPSMARKASPEAQPQPEPFAREAKCFTEQRVLHRAVQLTPLSIDKYGNLLCTVRLETLDLSEELLTAGLGRVADWSIALSNSAARLRLAESQAMQARRGVWQDYVPPSKPAAIGHFAGRVVEVVSGDIIVIANASTGVERRLGLASIRAPRLGSVRKGDAPSGLGLAAKEFLRSSFVGRQVAVEIEYVRTMGGGGEDGLPAEEPQRTIEMASVYEEKLDARGQVLARRSIAELLVASGLASVSRHKPGETRAARYDALLAAEEQARVAKRGMHSGNEPPVPVVHDLSRDPGRARSYQSTFLRAGRLVAIVDHIVSPGRLKLLLPKQNVQIMFAIAGIRSCMSSDPGASEVTAFLRQNVLQREVSITVETVNMKGVCMGSLAYSSTPGGSPSVNLALAMVQLGLAFVHSTSDGRAETHDLRAAEAGARDKRIGLWAHQVETNHDGQGEDETTGTECVAVVVSDVRSAQLFYIQRRGDLADITERIERSTPVGGFTPSVGTLCLAQFSADNKWYRGRVVRKLSGMFLVLFVDYGNEEELPPSRIAASDVGLAAVPSAAQASRLAFLAVPGLEKDFGLEAAQLLGSLTGGGRALTARIESRDKASGVVEVTLTPADGNSLDTEESVNATMLMEGLARVSRRALHTARGRIVADELRALQEQARRAHKGMFVYGDVDTDEDD